MNELSFRHSRLSVKTDPIALPIGQKVTLKVTGLVTLIEADAADVSGYAEFDALPGDVSYTLAVTKVEPC